MKQSFLLTAALLSLSAASQAAIIWSDDFSSDRAGTGDPNPYNYTGTLSGNDYISNPGEATFTVGGGILNVSDTTSSGTPNFSVASNRFSTTTFNNGDKFNVSVDMRVNSLLSPASGSASLPRFTIYTGNSGNGSESLTVGFGYTNFGGGTGSQMGFYKGGASANNINSANGIGIGASGFDFGNYSTTASENGTDGWYRISVNMTQGFQPYEGTITNLLTMETVTFSGNLVNQLNWGNNANGGIRIFAGLGGTSDFDIDNLVVTHVPEPSSVALLGGLGALALLRRRRA